MLNSQISAAIKNIHMHTEQRKIQEKVNDLMKNLTSSNLQLEIQSNTDELTQLLNRRGFYNKVDEILKNSNEYEYPCEIIVFDLDGLKIINDNFGHKYGDIAISEFSKILTTTFQSYDAIARFGGDEFVVLAKNIPPKIILKKLIEINKRTLEFTTNNPNKWKLSASMGNVRISTDENSDIDKLIEQADKVLYENKLSGR